jgi:3-methyl-2-oxobutanoate hydroxymethyltransferase
MPPTKKFTLTDLRKARESGKKLAMLTCYDFTTARLMQEAGVPLLLVGDSATNVILGHDTTVPASLDFQIEITAAVRRGAPYSFVIGDMPFGSYGGSIDYGVSSVCRMVKLSGCDCVKLEAADSHAPLVKALADIGVAVMAHLGLRPQTVGVLGGYRYQGRTAVDAQQIVSTALKMQDAGAVAILLEAVPPEVAKRVVDQLRVPVIGCGAGPSCHGHVVVTHDALGLTTHRPRFVPQVGDLATPLKQAFAEYVNRIASGTYPAPEHYYEMVEEEKRKF